jgi:PAS domain S-box-containing protein
MQKNKLVVMIGSIHIIQYFAAMMIEPKVPGGPDTTQWGCIMPADSMVDTVDDGRKSRAELLRELCEVRAHLARFRNLYEKAPMSYQSLDADGRVLEVNQAWLNTLGYSRDEVIGRPFDDFLHPDWKDHFKENFPRLKAVGEVLGVEFEMVKKSGSSIHVSLAGKIGHDPEGYFQQTHCIFHDITERKEAEDRLRESEKRFRTLVESVGEGIILQDAAERIVICNQTAAELFDVHTDMFISQVAIDRDWNIINEDGSPFPVNERPSLRTLRTGQPCNGVIMGVVRQGGETTWIKINTRPIFQEGETQPSAVVISFSNITERKQAEQALQELTSTLEQRVAERTQMADVRTQQLQVLTVELIEAEEREKRRVADLLHDDLQQILAAARFQLQTLGDTFPDETMLYDVEQLVDQSISKLRLLSYDLGPPVLYHSGLLAALQWLAKQMETQFGMKIAIEAVDGRPFESATVKVFIFRALQELLFNVVKHAEVKSACISLMGAGSRLVVTVSDKGRGFDPEILNVGTTPGGIGLLSLRERARYMGGDLEIESAPGKGSRLILKVPLSLARAYEVQQALPEAEQSLYTIAERMDRVAATDIRVLFVDDHKVMRQGLMKLVDGNPIIHVVGEASNGREAVELAHQLKPDLIVMDISMPEMDGIEATRRIKAQLPNVRVIGLSMHEDEQLAQAMRQAGAEAFVSKTASSAELLKAIFNFDRLNAVGPADPG